MQPEFIVLLALNASVIAGAFFFVRHLVSDHAAQRAEWSAEKKDLLNRVMTRDYPEYRAFEPPAERPKLRALLSDEDEARLEETAHGIPADLSDKDHAFIEELQAGR